MLGSILSLLALVLGLYLVVRPASAMRFLIKVSDKIDVLHPPGPIFTGLLFIIGAILVIVGALNLFR